MLQEMATITSKRQLTLPIQVFKRVGLKIGQKVAVKAEGDMITITPAEKLVEELAGSLKMPKKWRGKDIDEIIEEAKREYFKEKYSRKYK